MFVDNFKDPIPPKKILRVAELKNAIIIRAIMPIGLFKVTDNYLYNKRKNSLKNELFFYY
jgi:hypothetical protein